MLKLVITEKGGEPKQLTFDKDEITIGRVQGNDIVLPKGNISKRHSKISVRDGRFSVADLKSTNGTYVNGRKIADVTAVTASDKIYVGDFIVTLDAGAAGEDEETAPPPRRPAAPPPPPPPRAAPRPGAPPARVAKPALPEEDDDLGILGSPAPSGPTAPGRAAARPAPPPPPPPRREAAPAPPALDDEELGGGAASDEAMPSIDAVDEEEALAAGPPRRPVPPPLRPLPSLDEEEEPESAVSTGNLARAAVPAAAPAAPRSRAATGAHAPARATVVPGSLSDLLEDEGVAAVFITGADAVHVQRGTHIEPASLSLGDVDALTETLRQMAAMGTPAPAEDAAVIDVRLPDGGRLTALLAPVSTAGGPCATIRKPLRGGASLQDLAAAGGVSREAQQLLDACLAQRRNLLVTGDPAAALAFLAGLCAGIPGESRVVSVAHRAEISLPLPSWVTVSANGTPGVLSAAAGLRAEYLVVPDVGPDEAGDLLVAAAAGQEGLLCGVGGHSAGEALGHLEALAVAGGRSSGARELVASSFDLVASVATTRDGTVRLLELAEPRIGADGRLAAEAIVSWRPEGDGGRFQGTGVVPRVAASLVARGATLPPALLRK